MGAYGSGTYGAGAYGVGAGAGGGGVPTAASALPAIAVEVAFGLDPFASRLVAAFSLASVTSGQPNYLYVDLSAVADYTIQAGDVLEYDIYWPGASQWVGVDLSNAADTWILRATTALDQNGINAAPTQDISSRANGVWYHRTIPLTATSSVPGGSIAQDGTGQTITKFMLAMDHPGTGAVQSGTAYLRDIVITNGGRVVKKIWGQASAPPTVPSLVTIAAAPASGSTLTISKAKPLEPVVWSNINKDVRGLTIKRGRQHELDRIEAGTMQVALVNDNRQYDRNNSSGPYYPNVLPLRKIRARALWPLNLVTNGSFESDFSGWFNYGGATIARVANTTGTYLENLGSWVAQITPGGTHRGMGTSPNITDGIVGGQTYTFSAYINIPAGRTFSLYVDEFNAAGGFAAGGSWLMATGNGTMTRYSATVTLNAATASVILYILNEDAANPTILVDGVSLSPGIDDSPNLLSNPSFETSTGGWGVNNGSIARDTTTSLIGIACGKCVAVDATGNYVYSDGLIWGATAGRTYTGTVWVKGSGASIGKQVTAFLSEAGGATGESTAGTHTDMTVRLTANWQKLTCSRVMTQNDRPVARLYVSQQVGSATGDIVYIDAAQVELGAVATDWNPGYSGSGVWYSLFTGYVEQWPRSRSARRQTLEISCIDGLALFGDVTISKYYAQDISGNRINQVLDDLGWPTADRVIDLSSGESQIMPQGIISGASPEINGIQHMQDVAEAELGLLFVDGQGRAVFQSRQARIKPPFTISQAAFYNDPTASGNYQYIDLTPSNDSDQIFNYIYTPPASVTIVTDANRLLYLAEDLASQRQFGPRSFDRSPILATSDDGAQQANYLLARYKQPSTRYDDLVFEPTRQQELWPVLLGRELSDRITVVETFQTGSSITSDQHVESIVHRIDLGDRKRWQTNLSSSPADVQSYWALAGAGGDSWSANSILDQTTRLAY